MRHWSLTTDADDLMNVLARGADPNKYNKDGKTAIMIIIEKTASHKMTESLGSKLIVCLLDHGADLSLCDRSGDTVLHYAARACPDVVHQLLEAGADQSARNCKNETVSKYAFDHYVTAARPSAGGTAYARAQKILVRLFDKGQGDS
ncbi:hypothetical protein GGR57DRAFT_513392 [Xylariaceae sp. FL1272]|nr:hypothetical protein GGR57DRAFT_513392 [Xylariaceae sp. FL1272]